jgi:hypothetical protein
MGLFNRHSSDEKRPEGPQNPSYPPAAPPPAYPAASAPTVYSDEHKTPYPQHTSFPSSQQSGFGASSSAHYSSTFAALLLSRSDRIRIIGFPGDVIGAIDEAIKRVWAPGVQEQKAYDHASWEWKLRGNPCTCPGHTQCEI